jgi:hypothetical protein
LAVVELGDVVAVVDTHGAHVWTVRIRAQVTARKTPIISYMVTRPRTTS